jgi:single-strand DNA-binding protein
MLNKVTLIGHLGGDPETRTIESGSKVGRFSLATNESYKDKSGEWQNQTEWHNVVVWRELAERCERLKKGQLVYVEGKVSSRKYTDKDGVEKSVTDIVANTVRLLEKREPDNSRMPDAETRTPKPDATPTPEPADDLPF